MAREALGGGQSFQIQAYPFRMTAANMAAHKDDQWYDFWKNLKEGYDYFEITHLPPRRGGVREALSDQCRLRRSRRAS